jgi:Domain of unknown function (DUF4351)
LGRRNLGVAECRDESLIAILAAEGVCKTPLPKNHTQDQQRRNLFAPKANEHRCHGHSPIAPTPETLWLRLLGRGTVQSGAVAEILALPPNHPYKQQTLRHLAALQVNLRVRQTLTRDVQEVVMNLSPIYEQWRQETLAEGEQRGEIRGEQRGEQRQRSLILRLLTRKVGPIPEATRLHLEALSLEQLEELGEALLEFTTIADLTTWLETHSG